MGAEKSRNPALNCLISLSDKATMSLFHNRNCTDNTDSYPLKSYLMILHTSYNVWNISVSIFLAHMILWYGHLLKLNILFQLWWEASCWEELKWADRRQCTILIAVFLPLSVFLCWGNVIVVQPWLGLAGCLGPTDSQNHLQACWWFWDLIEDSTGFQEGLFMHGAQMGTIV